MPRGAKTPTVSPATSLRRARRAEGPVLRRVTAEEARIAMMIRSALSPDLLRGKWRGRASEAPHPMTGHCYVATEAAFYRLGGSEAGWRPRFISFKEGSNFEPAGKQDRRDSHWWLERDDGAIVDITGDQFPDPVPYQRGTNGAFIVNCAAMIGTPSNRTKKLLARISD